MAGSWRRRGTKVELRVYLGRDPLTGREVYRTRTIPDGGKRNADRALAAFVTEVMETHRARGSNHQFGELIDRWFTLRKGDWSPATAYQTRWVINHRLTALRHLPLRTLDTAALDEFYARLRTHGGKNGVPLSTSTVVRTHGVIRLVLDQAVRWGWIPSNPARHARPGKLQSVRVRPPSPEVVRCLLEAAAAKDRDLLTYVFLAAETGARRGELAALRLQDVVEGRVKVRRALAIGELSDENLRLYCGHIWPAGTRRGQLRTALIEKAVPKTTPSIRTIALSATANELVREHAQRLCARASQTRGTYEPNGFLFPADILGTRPLRADVWSRRFATLCGRVGVDNVRLHDMRHFVATTLLTAGVDLATVAGRLGHGGGGKTTLAIYGHFLSEPDREASNVMSRLLTLPGRDDPLRGVAGSRHDVQLPQPGVGGTPIFDEYPTNTRAGKAQGASRCRDAEPSL